MISRWANPNPFNLDTNEVLDILNVFPRLVGQVVIALRASCRLLPSREGFIVDLDLCQHLRVGREAVKLLAVDGVRCRDLELVEVVEDIKFGQVDGSVVIAGVRVLNNNKIEPTAASLSPCRYTDLMAN